MSDRKQILFLVALVSSLAVNIFLGGFLMGHHLAHGRDRPPPPPPSDKGLERVLQMLPEASRAKIVPLVQKHKEVMRPQQQQVQQAQEAMFVQLTADPLNPQALSEALTHLQQEKHNIQKTMGQFLIEAAGVLTWEERQQLVEGMRRNAPPPPGEKFPPPPPPPPGD